MKCPFNGKSHCTAEMLRGGVAHSGQDEASFRVRPVFLLLEEIVLHSFHVLVECLSILFPSEQLPVMCQSSCYVFKSIHELSQ